jgi:hypothetical protein
MKHLPNQRQGTPAGIVICLAVGKIERSRALLVPFQLKYDPSVETPFNSNEKRTEEKKN